MARPRKDSFINLKEAHDLTEGLIARLVCPLGKDQAFLRDNKAPALRVRVTASGAKSFVFEAKLNRQTVRRTIGDVRAWTIDAARTEANKLRVTLDLGQDPREIDRQAKEAKQLAKAAEERAANFTFAALLNDYADQLEKLGRVSHSKVRGIFKKHLTESHPELAAMPAALVTSEQVTDLMRRLNDAGKMRTAGKFRSYARAAFEMARTAGTDSELPVRFKSYGVRHNPIAETKAIKRKDDKNPLMPVHLRQYWQAIKSLQGIKGALLRLQLLTGGQRIEQLCCLLTANVKTDSITLSDAKGRAANAARRHEVPLIAPAREALDELTAQTTDGKFALSLTGGDTHISADMFSRWAKAAASEIDWVAEPEPVSVFKAKRIRSGVETILASLKVSEEVRGHLLSHGLTGVQVSSYNGHDYFDVKYEALELLFNSLEGQSGSVTHVSFDRRRA